MVAAGKNPSPPGPEEAAAGEAVAEHIIILAAAAAAATAASSLRAGQADTRAHTALFQRRRLWQRPLVPAAGHYKDGVLLLLLGLLFLPPAPPSPLLGPLI